MSLNAKDGMPSQTDEELAVALKRGDQSAFEELVRRHQGRVYAIAYRMTSNREDALDVAQEALLKAYRKIDSWAPTGSFGAWMTRLAANQCIDHLRRMKRHRHERLDESFRRDSGMNIAAPKTEQTETQVRGIEIDDRIQSALGVLSPSQRAVFVLRHYEGKSLAEIAPVLGCTVGSVKVHLFRALKKLRVELGDLHE